MESETVSTVSNSNAPSVTKGYNLETQAFLDRAAKQTEKWEKVEKECDKVRAKKEEKFSQALE
eukprot:12025063-Ditylum_brightwellii.AAC.1